MNHSELNGVRVIPIETPKGTFQVWTRRVGDNPSVKVLLLHGGPGFTHEAFEALDDWFPAAGIEYYYYDQLGSKYSDQPDDPDLWEIDRFVDEVEQVRVALGLNPHNFFLLGHSWGGILAIEYALKHQEHLKGLIISNMMASIPAYNEYAESVLKPGIAPAVLAEMEALEAKGEYESARYIHLMMEHHYVHHVLRRPSDQWPEPVRRAGAHQNQKIYVPLQGPSELGAKGKILHWDRVADLHLIEVPTLSIGARYDTMDPRHMEMLARRVARGRSLTCPDGSHFALYDDQKCYMQGLIAFLADVDSGRF